MWEAVVTADILVFTSEAIVVASDIFVFTSEVTVVASDVLIFRESSEAGLSFQA